MAYRFVGNYDVTAEGKFLWEILCQLRGFGVGRVVTKNEWMRKWPEQPSYLRVVKAHPGMDRWLFNGKLWAEWTYRGRNLGIYEFNKDLNRSDWRLVHKHEEKALMECGAPVKEVTLPSTYPIPPLQALFMKKAAQKNGTTISEDDTRVPLKLCVDPEFQMFQGLVKQAEPAAKLNSIYDEVDKEVLLDLFGKELPLKVEAWNLGPAKFSPRFSATETRVQEQSSS